MKKFILIILIISVFSFRSFAQDNQIIVLVKYKALTEKSSEAISNLNSLIEQVKGENHFVKIVMHVDPSDSTNILLYEEWDNENYYKNEHMKTPHIQKFVMDSRGFLAGPPEITFWRLEETF